MGRMPASRKARFCEYGCPNGSQARCRDDSRFELHLAPHLPHPQFPEAHAQPRDFPILAALRRQFVDDELRRIMNLCGADDVQHWMQLNNRAAFCVATKGDVLDPRQRRQQHRTHWGLRALVGGDVHQLQFKNAGVTTTGSRGSVATPSPSLRR